MEPPEESNGCVDGKVRMGVTEEVEMLREYHLYHQVLAVERCRALSSIVSNAHDSVATGQGDGVIVVAPSGCS